MTEKIWMALSKTKGTVAYEGVADLQEQLGRAPTVKEILDLRYDADMSIEAAGDLIADNFKTMKNYGYDASQLDIADREKLAYLMHHEGAPQVNKMLKGAFSEAEGQKRLNSNLGAKAQGPYLAQASGSYAKAYQSWLGGMVDERFNPGRYSMTSVPESHSIPYIMNALRAQKDG